MSLLGNIVSGAGRVASLVPGIGTVAGAGLNVLGSAIGSSINQADDRSYAQQLWDNQNSYNDPAAQVDRLKKAGLNPNMVFGQVGTSGSATTMPDSVKVSDSNSNNHAMDAMTSMLLTMSQIALNSSEAAKNQASVPVLNSQIPLNQSIISKNYSDVDLNAANSAFVELQASNQSLRNGLLAKYGDKQMVSDIDNVVQDTALKHSSTLDNMHDIKLKAAQILKEYASAHNLNVQSQQIQAMLPYTIQSLQQSIASQWITNGLNKNELDWQNGTNSKSQFGYGNNYQQLRNSQLKYSSNSVTTGGLLNQHQRYVNSTYFFDKLMDLLKTGSTVGAAASFMAR